MSQLGNYLTNPSNWFSVGSIIQATVWIMFAVGILMAMPDEKSSKITSKDNLGVYISTIAATLISFFALLSVEVSMVLSAFIAGVVGAFAYRRGFDLLKKPPTTILPLLLLGSSLGTACGLVPEGAQVAATPAVAQPSPYPTQTAYPTYTPYPTVVEGEAEATVAPSKATPRPVATPRVEEDECPTTAQAKKDLGLDVQRLDTEVCSFVVRYVGVGSAMVTTHHGYVHTLHLVNDKIQVFQGDDKRREILAGTFRFISAFPLGDAVYEPCVLLKKEQEFGNREVPSFPVSAGNFSCP